MAQTHSRKRFSAVLLVLALVFAYVARQYLHRYPLSATAAVAIYCCFMLLLTLALAPAFAAGSGCPRFAIPNPLFIVLWLLPYLIYAAGTHDFHWASLLRLLAIAAPAPLLYALFPVRQLELFHWQDALLAAWMIAAVLAHLLAGIWTRPVNLDFMGRLFLIVVAASTWTFIRPVPGLGYHFSFSTRAAKAIAVNFTLFTVIALPVGLTLHFIAWNPHWRGALSFALDYLEILLFIALLEELFFRGFLQNLLSQTFRTVRAQRWTGQFIASLLFGLSHIFHAPVPNWRYVALASIAGWFYGTAFRAGGGILASGLTHALVDTAWRTWFSLH